MRNIAHHIKNLDMDCYEKYGHTVNSAVPIFLFIKR
jgi:hypothetical protein